MLVALQLYGLYSASPPMPDGPVGTDKVAHVLGFGAPALVAALLRSRWVLWFLVLHALAAELIQDTVAATRHADPWDTVANLVGVTLGVLVAHALRRVTGATAGDDGSMTTQGPSR